MRILIAYDGSSCSDAALDDLQRGGLPETAEALVISVAEVWLPPVPENVSLSEYAKDLQSHPQPFAGWKTGAKSVTEVETFANHAQKKLQRNFPNWNISSEFTYGSPAWEILDRAATFKPDLIVVGSHGRSAISRLLLGSISQKVLTEAHSSVRVARGKIEGDPFPVRVVIGFDGSEGSVAAVEAVASRQWREDSEFKLVAVLNQVTPTDIGRFMPPVPPLAEEVNEDERKRIEKLAQPCLQKLRDMELNASLCVHAGNPKRILAEVAESWNAEAVFLGANHFGTRLERFLLGSVSAAVAARVRCTVEVVRKQEAFRRQEAFRL